MICAYATRGDFGQITVVVPPPGERDAARYHADRAAYFRSYRASARPVRGLGLDAWIGGDTTLRVLARDDLYFAVAVQTFPEGVDARRTDDVLIPLARAVLARLDGRGPMTR